MRASHESAKRNKQYKTTAQHTLQTYHSLDSLDDLSEATLQRLASIWASLGGVVVDSVWAAHGQSAVVGVAASTVPVTLDGLGLEAADDIELLAYAVHDVARHPEVVASVDSLAWANLVFPLTGHDLGIDARELDAGIEAGLQVSISNVAAIRVVGARGAVILALGSREATTRPAKRSVAVNLKECVLLLNAVPGLGLLDSCSLEDLEGIGAVVVSVDTPSVFGGEVVEGLDLALTQGLVCVTQHQDVVAATEWVAEDGGWPASTRTDHQRECKSAWVDGRSSQQDRKSAIDRPHTHTHTHTHVLENDFRVVTWGLTSAGAVKVPQGKL
jgi:hypothetical protein